MESLVNQCFFRMFNLVTVLGIPGDQCFYSEG